MKEADINKLNHIINQKIDYCDYEKANGSAGASLGLTMSNLIAKKLDKKPSQGIGFKSVFGNGTKFFFSIKNTQSSHKVSFINLLKMTKNLSNNKSPVFLSQKQLPMIDEKLFSHEALLKNSSKCSSINCSGIFQDLGSNQHHDVYQFPEIKPFQTNFSSKTQATQELKPDSEKHICEHEPILVVDDDEFNIFALKMLLKMKKLTCLEARNGKIAIDIVKEQTKIREGCCVTFKLILMDLNMPVMNGIEASRKLNQAFEEGSLPWIPIVMCTAYGREHNELGEKYDSGIVEVIHKPLRFETLSKVLSDDPLSTMINSHAYSFL